MNRYRALGYALVGAGALLGASLLLFPTQVESAVWGAKVFIDEQTRTVVEQVTGEPQYPTITLGEVGGEWELSYCNGKWIEMEDYRLEGVPPVYAAHNDCGGDVILNLQLGEKVRIIGRDELYEVVGDRLLPRPSESNIVPVTKLKGLTGDLALQSCFYGNGPSGYREMRYVSLSPVAAHRE